MMRRDKTYRIAGNCCCLIPVLILAAIVFAAVIGGGVVWRHPGFSWDSARHHYSDAYADGYREGNRSGAGYAAVGDPEPTGQELDALARREADGLHVRRDRKRWIEGFRSGFARGFGRSNRQANIQ